MKTVRDLMRTASLTLEVGDSLRAAADLLTSSGVSGAPVMRGEQVVGVASLTDILAFEADDPGVPTYRDDRIGELEEDESTSLEALEEPAARWFVEMWEDAGADVVSRFSEPEGPEWDSLDAHTVEEVMSRRVLSVPRDATLRHAAEVMERERVHRLLVIEDGELAGILSASDFVRALAENEVFLVEHRAEGGVMDREKERPGGEAAPLEELREEIRALRRALAALEQRVARLEVREELWQAPEAAGDEPVPS